MLPLELPGPPASCVAFQLLRVWMLLTLFALEGMEGPPLEVVGVLTEPPPLTVTATSATQEAPLLPQALTCKV